jgi:hypothetical protein
MKLTELILELHTIVLEKGNLDVVVHVPDRDYGDEYKTPGVDIWAYENDPPVVQIFGE